MILIVITIIVIDATVAAQPRQISNRIFHCVVHKAVETSADTLVEIGRLAIEGGDLPLFHVPCVSVVAILCAVL